MNVAALVVLPEDAREGERLRHAFAAAGFTVGPLVGRSFSIEAPRERMESWFPDFGEREGTGAELRLDTLDPELAHGIQAVVSEAPPEFGPGSY